MHKLFIGFVCMLCFVLFSQAQYVSKNTKIVYLELLGNSDLYSINFEYVFHKNHGIRLGASWVPGTWNAVTNNDRHFFYFPFEYNYLIGHKHLLDLSVGVQTTVTYYTQDLPNHYRFRPQLGVAYRYQNSKGIFGRVGITANTPYFLSADVSETFFYTNSRWLIWPLLAGGWSF
ncbi:MAG: hypothetical protein V4643_00190 [Bacteroidota bacterium]